MESIHGWAAELGLEVEVYQSNHEGDLVTRIQEAYGNTDGIVINAAAYHKGHVLTVEATLAEHDSILYRRELVEYDTAFQRIGAQEIQPLSLMRSDKPIGYLPPVVAIDSSTERPYAYTPSLQPTS